jgi:large-conductance mechanosensitive channel
MDHDDENATAPNPYAPGPPREGDADELESRPDISPGTDVFPSVPRTILRWTLVCSIAAIPSFVVGFTVTQGQLWGMVTGIAIFIVGYVWADLVTRPQSWRHSPQITATLRTVYVLRMVASVVLPAGMIVDMFSGMLAVMIVAGVNQFETEPEFGFVSAVCTTLVQGVLLNVILLIVAFCVFPIVRLMGRAREKRKQRSAISNDQTPLDSSSDSSSESLANPLLSSSDSSPFDPSLR